MTSLLRNYFALFLCLISLMVSAQKSVRTDSLIGNTLTNYLKSYQFEMFTTTTIKKINNSYYLETYPRHVQLKINDTFTTLSYEQLTRKIYLPRPGYFRKPFATIPYYMYSTPVNDLRVPSENN